MFLKQYENVSCRVLGITVKVKCSTLITCIAFVSSRLLLTAMQRESKLSEHPRNQLL